jgi:ABC-type transport system involved in cytochrome bd biosynthesis fused ATPase/permease subunit
MRSQFIFYQGTEVPIFKGTLQQNLLFHCKSSGMDNKLLEAIEMFDLASVYSRLGGLNGKVQESGRNLSAGERKKVALCRAWLTNSRILLLDEIDDALDSSSMSLVNQILQKPNTTVLLISHRQVETGHFDRIIDLDSQKQ